MRQPVQNPLNGIREEDSGGLKLCRGKGQVPEIAVLPAFYYFLRIAAQGFHGPYSRLVEVKGVRAAEIVDAARNIF